MADRLLSTTEAAEQLGISRATLYAWVSRSNAGEFILRGQPVTIEHFQSGPQGQGRIQFESEEIQRLRELMRVRPRTAYQRRPPVRRQEFPGIHVKLGDIPG